MLSHNVSLNRSANFYSLPHSGAVVIDVIDVMVVKRLQNLRLKVSNHLGDLKIVVGLRTSMKTLALIRCAEEKIELDHRVILGADYFNLCE
ncbi:unnamed protein product [Echinostoma caproni]|uniref:Reverse transcriptase n=1 Tax=Echinostoma caproni TaxID=27848 RepID=A0A183AZX9_9TREM|nr:unnamed protein product [Echinostoma caproni]